MSELVLVQWGHSEIEWERLPSLVMEYLIRTVADSPDAVLVALAVGSAMHEQKPRGMYTYIRHYLLRFFLMQSSSLPWRAISFFEEATNYILLQRVGEAGIVSSIRSYRSTLPP